MFKNFTCLLFGSLFLYSAQAQTQTFTMGIVGTAANPCAAPCNPTVCSPTASTSNPGGPASMVYETVNSSPVTIPANSSVRIQIVSVLCGSSPASIGPGLDIGDTLSLNGITIFAPDADNPNSEVSYDQCFSTSAAAGSVTISLKANRRDETVRVTVTTTAGPGAGCAILPTPLRISLAYFNAQKQADESVKLKWVTSSEQNNRYMAVERSADGKLFTEVGRINGVANSSSARSYELIDRNPISGNVYYRLRSIDYDGTNTYSRVVLVIGKGSKRSLFVYPNPSSDAVQVSAATKIEDISVVDVKGSVLIKQIVGNSNTQKVDLQQVPKGIYILRIKTAGQVLTEKLVKN